MTSLYFKKINLSNIELIKTTNNCIVLKHLNKNLIFNTPELFIQFGIEKEYNNFILKLRISKKNLDFCKFIENLEEKINQTLNIKITSSLRKDSKYDPLLICKLPFKNDKFLCDFIDISGNHINPYSIEKKMSCKCSLIIDKIWKFNNKYYYKLRVKKMFDLRLQNNNK